MEVKRIVSKKYNVIYTVEVNPFGRALRVVHLQSLETGKYYKIKSESKERRIIRTINKHFLSQKDSAEILTDAIDDFVTSYPLLTKVSLVALTAAAIIVDINLK